MFLKRGGTLWLDDCYLRGSPFSDSVRPEVTKMIPGSEPIMLTKDDPKVNDAFRMIYAMPWPGAAEFENRPWEYFLLDGRPAVFFTPNDDGCSWEVSTPPSASNPIGEGIGHGGDNREREVMYQWAANFMLFAYTHLSDCVLDSCKAVPRPLQESSTTVIKAPPQDFVGSALADAVSENLAKADEAGYADLTKRVRQGGPYEFPLFMHRGCGRGPHDETQYDAF